MYLAQLSNLLLLSACVLGQNQEIVLYSEQNKQGDNLTLDHAVSDLSSENFDNKAVYVCLTGIWMLYSDPNFNPTLGQSATNMWYAWSFGPEKSCTSLPTSPDIDVAGNVSSVRFAGDVTNYKANTLNLFQHIYLQGEQLMTTDDISNVGGNYTSLIVTGNISWTLFPQQNFQGDGICITASSKGWPVIVTDLTNKGIEDGDIRSLKKGCQ